MPLEKPASLPLCARRLAELGYWIVPIAKGNKGPHIKGWQAYRLTPDQAEAVVDNDGLIGILHTNVAAIDIDICDPDLAAEVIAEAKRRFPGALERIGQAPKSALFFRFSGDWTMQATERHEVEGVTAQVEIRTKTRQIVAYGKHPVTGEPYTWPDGQLWATPRTSLPEADQAAFQAFRDWANARIREWAGAPDPEPIPQREFPRLVQPTKATDESVREALSHIPPSVGYDEWLRCLMALHDHYNGSETGLAVAQDWSSPYPHYSPREVEQKWRSFEPGRGVSARTIFAAARTHGADLRAIGRPAAAPDDWRSDFKVEAAPNRSQIVTQTEPDRSQTEAEPPQNGRPPFDTTPITLADLQNIPPREWLYGRKFIAGFVTIIASPGGMGKSSWATAIACDCAGGTNNLHDDPHEAMATWVYNLEDPRDETLRKVAAIHKWRGLTDKAIGNLTISSGRDRPLIVAEEVERGVFVASPDVDLLIEAIMERGIRVLIVDPAVRAHRLPENDNKAIDLMMDAFAHVAAVTGCAIVLIHHTKKGYVSGEADSVRGASAMTSAARAAFTLQVMSREEATEMNITEADRLRYIRVDNAKSNLAPQSANAEWIKLESQSIDNGNSEYPDGDNVQVATAWAPPSPFEDLGPHIADIFDRLERGYTNDEGITAPWVWNKNGKDRWAVNAVQASFPDGSKSITQCRVILSDWLKRDFIELRRERCPISRKEREMVFVKNPPSEDDHA